jgi:uncharacterized protein YukE
MPEGTGFTVDPEFVRNGASKLSIAADQLADAGAALQAALAAQGECWGNDESGKEFAKDYVPGSKNAGEAFGSLADGLRALQKNIETAMASIENADNTVKNTLGKGR